MIGQPRTPPAPQAPHELVGLVTDRLGAVQRTPIDRRLVAVAVCHPLE